MELFIILHTTSLVHEPYSTHIT